MLSQCETLRSFLGPDGRPTRPGQRRAGMWQAAMGQPLTSRLPWESDEEFAIRKAAYEAMKKPPPRFSSFPTEDSAS